MPAEPVILTTRAMGTSFELVLAGEACDRRKLVAAGEAALEVIRDVEARWSLFLPDSRLALLNRTGHARAIALDADDCELFEVAASVHEASAGAFDPNVARAMDAAGHFAQRGLTPILGHQKGPASATWRFDVHAKTISFSGPGPALDLGGIAKGHALDLAARELQECGVTSALLHGGTSSVVAFGAPPDQEAWLVRCGEVEVPLNGIAIATSRADSQSAEFGTHILNPGSSGKSVGCRNAATVLAPSAALADAWATALCVRPDLSHRAANVLVRQGVTVLSLHEPLHNV